MVRSFQDLVVWQKSMDMVEEVYRLVRLLPQEERFALCDQMRRAVVSIPSNIAEGQAKARFSSKEFAKYLLIAKGSNAEINTQLLICVRLGYISKERIQTAMGLNDEVGKMLSSFIDTVRRDSVKEDVEDYD